MLLNLYSSPINKLRPSVCSQYLRKKVALKIVVRNVKKQLMAIQVVTIKWLILLATSAIASCVLCVSALYAEDLPTEPKMMSLDLIELLGGLGDDEADLDAAMALAKVKQVAKKSAQTKPLTKPVTSKNLHKGAIE